MGLRWWRLQIYLTAAALALAVLRCLQVYLGALSRHQSLAWKTIAWTQAPPYIVWSIVAMGLIYLARDVVRRGIGPRRIILASLGLMLLAAVGVPALYLPLYWPYPEAPGMSFAAAYRQEALAAMGTSILMFCMISGIAYCVFYYAQARENGIAAARLSGQLSQARLEALRAQLNPHFLFNAMNSIAMLARRGDQAAAVRMVAGLSDLLRYSLDEARPQVVTLRDELEFVTRYLEIEHVRFGDQLRVVLDVDETLMDAEVPSLAVQTLVENAVRHGLSNRAGMCEIRVGAVVVGGALTLTIRDNGAGPDPSATNGSAAGRGVGISNTRARLRELYGDEGALELARAEGGGAVATLRLPWSDAPLLAARAAR